MFEKAIALDPQYAEAYAWLGVTYYFEWDWRWSADPQTLEQVFALAQQALALDDSLPIAHGLLGMAYAQKQQYEQALAEGERAIVLDPNNVGSYAMQAEVLNFMGRPEEALRSVEKALRLDPRTAFYLIQVSWAYNSMGRYAEAIAAVKTLLLRHPNFLYAYSNLAISYLSQWLSQLSQDPQTLAWALAAAQRAVALNDALWVAHLVLGSVYLYQQQYDQALAEMERGVALNHSDASSYASLAAVLSCVSRSEDAVGAAEKALGLKPFVVDEHLLNVGAAYDLAGRPEEAIAPLKQYLSHYPNILGAHLTLAAVYSELGREAEARTEAAEVLRLNPQFSLEVHKQRVPIKEQATLERHLAALRKAGLK